MATAKKTPSGKWRVLAYVGKNVTKSGYKSFTADTKKEAERLAASFAPPEPGKEEADITVGQAIDRYIDMKDAVLSPSTIRAYKILRHTMLQELMDIQACSLTQAEVQGAVNADAAAGKSPKTLRNAHGLLTSALHIARPEFTLRTTFPQRQKPDIQIPSKEEVYQLLDAAPPPLANAICLAAMLGLRRSEICALTWEDFRDGCLVINKAIVRGSDNKWIVKPPKSVAGYRVLPMPETLIRRFASGGSGRVFPFNPDNISWHFSALQRKCFGQVKYRFHDLRHYNASIMLALGVPDKYAMERMGHSTNNMLKSVYQHTMLSKQQEISSQLNKFFDDDTTQNTTQK